MNRLLLVEDDPVFARVITRALSYRGFEAMHAESLEAAREFRFAILDLNLGGQTSLELLPLLRDRNPEVRTLILTGYASIATAVDAIKLGATNYLAKPADTEEILHALLENAPETPGIEAARQPMSVRRLEWEHIQSVLKKNDGNISRTARQLKMHRRTLQRKLQKRPVSE